jgi:hypothetical protein
MRSLLKKRSLVVIAVLCALGVTGAAIAYWTQAGSGTGTGTVGTTGTVTLQGPVTAGIYPGGSTAVTLTASNSASAPVKVQTVSMASIAVDAGHSTCNTADFTMPTVTENTSLAGNAVTQPLTANGVLTMANTAANQDACKGATLTLTLSST